MPPHGITDSEMIATERLDLVLLSVPQVLAFEFDHAGTDLLADMPFDNPHGLLVDDLGPMRFRVAQVKADPCVNPWLVRVIVKRSTNVAIGIINFHGAPNVDGMIEIGYRVVEAERRKGFAREAVVGMFDWALKDPQVRTFRASISPDNVASRNLVASLGFAEVGMQQDDEDGPEIIYEVRRSRSIS